MPDLSGGSLESSFDLVDFRWRRRAVVHVRAPVQDGGKAAAQVLIERFELMRHGGGLPMQAKYLDLSIDTLGNRQRDFLQGFRGDSEFFADAGQKFEGHERFSTGNKR